MKEKFTKQNTLCLKGIAIIMMVIHHTIVYRENYDISFFPFNYDFVMYLAIMFRICVSIFVFITGYGLFLSYKNKKEQTDVQWIIQRIIKLLSGFFIITILSFVICQFIDGYTSKVYFENGIVKGIIQMIKESLALEIHPIFNGHWWYMNIAIMYVLSVPIFEKVFKKYNYTIVLLAVILIPRMLLFNFERASYIGFLFPLLLGMIFAQKDYLVKIANYKIINNPVINKIVKFILETILIAICYILYKNMEIELYWEINYGIIPVFIICYCYEFFLDIPILKNILSFLGKHSMNIYCVHYFVKMYMSDWIYSFKNWMIISLAVLGVSLIISIILELFKKIIQYNRIIDKIQLFIDKKIKRRSEIDNKENLKELETI